MICFKIANFDRTEASLTSKWGRISPAFHWCYQNQSNYIVWQRKRRATSPKNLFRQITHYLAEQFRQIAHYMHKHTFTPAYLHTCIPSNSYFCIILYLHTYALAYLSTFIFMNFHTCILTYLHTCIIVYLHTCILPYLNTCILVYWHTCILAYLHTYLHAYLRTCIPEFIVSRTFHWIRYHLSESGVPPNSVLFGGTVPPNSVLFGGTVLPNSLLFGGTVPPNSFPFFFIFFWSLPLSEAPNPSVRPPILHQPRKASAYAIVSFILFWLLRVDQGVRNP